MSVARFVPTRHTVFVVAWVVLLAYFFANVEIQIEGSAGWAANLPTWRIEHHWLLDLFWGGRPMTGYHAGCSRSSRCSFTCRPCSTDGGRGASKRGSSRASWCSG
jgi:hypothetical protein